MIKSFKNKGLKELFDTGTTRKIGSQNHAKCLRLMDVLDAAKSPRDMNIPGFKFHGLKTKPKSYSVWVTGNYRITFEWENEDAVDVNYVDYH